MAQQVSGSDRTLIEAIRSGEVETPPLMGWNRWQQWRREAGMRPTVARDHHTTTAAQETALWRSVMTELHGPDWTSTLAEQEVESARASGDDPAQTTRTRLSPSGVAGDGGKGGALGFTG